MEIDELLKPRFLCIAEYPNSPFKVGDIALKIHGTLYCNIETACFCGIENIEKYPHLFKPLQWFENRKVEELPSYIKSGTQVVKPDWELIKWRDREYWRANTNEKLFGSHYKLELFLPATEQEYLQNTQPKLIHYQCANCGNTCLQETKPDNTVCGKCNKPDWKIMVIQEAYNQNIETYLHPGGEI